MAKPIIIVVKENILDLKTLFSKSPIHLRPRYKMLMLICGGYSSSLELAAKIGVSRNTIAAWKQQYLKGGIDMLIDDQRGGDYISNISNANKKKIEQKLADPKNAFTSFGEAQTWLKNELGIDKKYHAVNKYLKRNFGAKLKVGRKSHVKKDDSAAALFKKTT